MDIRKTDLITFVVFTYNESARIGRVIQNFKPFGSILIVDNYSTDDTLKIAEMEGCDILLNKNAGWVEDSVTTARVKEKVTTDWIYWGFADEMVDGETLMEIIGNVESGKYDIINIIRKNYYYGRFLYDAYADRMNRIFRKDAIDFNGNKIHGFGKSTVLENRIKFLPKNFFVHHFISNTAKSYLAAMDRYTDIEADEGPNQAHFSIAALRSAKRFLGNYFIRGAFKAGEGGFYLAFLASFYPILAHMKRHEAKTHLTRTEIEYLNNIKRKSIVSNILKVD